MFTYLCTDQYAEMYVGVGVGQIALREAKIRFWR
jgi:hypothetical protein